MRTIFAIAADRDLRLDQWALKNSFIQQRLDVEHMYMECPDGYSKTMESGEPAAIQCLQSIAQRTDILSWGFATEGVCVCTGGFML